MMNQKSAGFVKLATVVYARETTVGDPRWLRDHKWVPCGDILFNARSGKAVLRLTGLRQGWMLARRDDEDRKQYPIEGNDPYINGQIEVTIKDHPVSGIEQRCGFIFTEDEPQSAARAQPGTGKIVHYKIKLECVPCLAGKDRDGVFFRIEEGK